MTRIEICDLCKEPINLGIEEYDTLRTDSDSPVAHKACIMDLQAAQYEDFTPFDNNIGGLTE